jgi:hypothetical protein
VVSRHGSAAGHGWRWPVVRPVPTAGEMEEVGLAGELEEDGRRRQRFEEKKYGPAH